MVVAQSFNWSEDIKGLVDAVVETFRQKTIELVGRAYTTISLSELASSLGLSEGDAVKSRIYTYMYNIQLGLREREKEKKRGWGGKS